MEKRNERVYPQKECPVCGEMMDDIPCNICENCNWETNVEQEEYFPDSGGGPNVMSFNEAKKAYAEGRPVKKTEEVRGQEISLAEKYIGRWRKW